MRKFGHKYDSVVKLKEEVKGHKFVASICELIIKAEQQGNTTDQKHYENIRDNMEADAALLGLKTRVIEDTNGHQNLVVENVQFEVFAAFHALRNEERVNEKMQQKLIVKQTEVDETGMKYTKQAVRTKPETASLVR